MWHDSRVFTYSDSFNSANNPKHCYYELHFTHRETIASWVASVWKVQLYYPKGSECAGVVLLCLGIAAVEEAVLQLDGLEVGLEDNT